MMCEGNSTHPRPVRGKVLARLLEATRGATTQTRGGETPANIVRKIDRGSSEGMIATLCERTNILVSGTAKN